MNELPDRRLEFERIIEVLNKHRVKYIVIGGMAAILHGVPFPPTLDLDITPSPTDRNKASLAKALIELEAKLRAPGLLEGIEIPLDARTFTGMTTMTFITWLGPLDVSFNPDGTTGYDDLRRNAVTVEHAGLEIPVASLADILRSKETAGRPKDRPHIAIITEYLGRREAGS